MTTETPFTLTDVLNARRTEVREVNEANGWFEADRTLGEGIALMHSEVAEALDAYRSWGLEDATALTCNPCVAAAEGMAAPAPGHLCKPEGIGSELADVLIRLLDETDRQDVPLDAFTVAAAAQGDYDRFGEACARLHEAIVAAGLSPTGERFGIVYATLVETCETYGVDLGDEYARKIAYNATRGHRHGGKRL